MAYNIGFIGDSITHGSSVPSDLNASCACVSEVSLLNGEGFTATGVNQGHSGSDTNDWLPGSGYLTDALTAFVSAGVTHVQIMLGTNDALLGVTTSDYTSNMSAIIAEVLNGHGITDVMLNYSPYLDNPYDSHNAQLVVLQGVIDSLCNGSTIKQGDKLAYSTFQSNVALLSDHIHPTQAGYDVLGQLWETAFKAAYGLNNLASKPRHPSHLLQRNRSNSPLWHR